MGDISSPHPTTRLSSNPESDLDILDSYNHCIGNASQVQALNDDPDLPIYQLGLSTPIDTEIIARKLLLKQFPKSAIAKRNRPLCNKNAVFLINLSNLVHWKDILLDLHGYWKHSKTKQFRFYVNQENVFKVKEDDDICIEETIEVQRLIYCHNESLDFHRVVIVIENCELACLQYYFDGQEYEVKSTVPRENAKLKRSQKPYIRTKKSVLEKIKKSSLPPKQTVSAIIKNGGG